MYNIYVDQGHDLSMRLYGVPKPEGEALKLRDTVTINPNAHGLTSIGPTYHWLYVFKKMHAT